MQEIYELLNCPDSPTSQNFKSYFRKIAYRATYIRWVWLLLNRGSFMAFSKWLARACVQLPIFLWCATCARTHAPTNYRAVGTMGAITLSSNPHMPPTPIWARSNTFTFKRPGLPLAPLNFCRNGIKTLVLQKAWITRPSRFSDLPTALHYNAMCAPRKEMPILSVWWGRYKTLSHPNTVHCIQ